MFIVLLQVPEEEEKKIKEEIQKQSELLDKKSS